MIRPVSSESMHAERLGLGARHPDAGDRDPGPALDVLGDHLARVHPVHVVGAEHRDVVGPLVVDQVQALEDRVRAAGVPAPAEPLLGRHRGDVLPEHAGQPPGGGDVPVQRVRLVLGEHADPVQPGVDQVGQHEVDQPVVAAERHGRLGPVGGERPQPLALAAGQHDAEHVGRQRPWRCGLQPRAGHAASDPSAAAPERAVRPPQHRSIRGTAGEPSARNPGAGCLTVHGCASACSPANTHRTSTAEPASTSNTWCPALRELVDVDVHCFGEPREGAAGHLRAPHAQRAGRRERRAADARRRPVHGGRRWSGVDLAHSHTWYANMAGHLAKILHGVPHVVTAHSLEPRRPWKAEQLGGGYRLSSWVERTAYEARRRGDRGERGHAPRRPGVLPGAGPGPGARGAQRHRHRLLPPGPGPGRGARRRRSTRTGRAWCSSGGSPGRRASGTWSRRPTRSTATPRSCCAPVRRTPRRSPRRPRRRSPSCSAARPGVIWVRGMLPTAAGPADPVRGHRVRLPVGVRAAGHRQPGGDGLRHRGGGLRRRRHPGGRRRRRDRAAGALRRERGGRVPLRDRRPGQRAAGRPGPRRGDGRGRPGTRGARVHLARGGGRTVEIYRSLV